MSEEEAVAGWPERLAQAALALALFLMMGLTFVDVLGRYAFNAPLPGAKELTELLMAAAVFGAAPLVALRREHITTALFDEMMSPGLLRIRDVSVALVSALASGVLAWRIWVQADMIRSLAGATTLLQVPIAPLAYFMALMSAAGTVVLLAMAVAALRGAGRANVRRDAL